MICNNRPSYAKENCNAKSGRTHPRFSSLSRLTRSKGGTSVTKHIPAGIDRAVRGVCEDYPRRRDAILDGALPPETLAHYTILNAKIDRAIASCCDESFCEEMREDIGNGTGHRATALTYLGINTYKTYKHKSKLAIAHALHLL